MWTRPHGLLSLEEKTVELVIIYLQIVISQGAFVSQAGWRQFGQKPIAWKAKPKTSLMMTSISQGTMQEQC